ncbi:hypothetical protein AgCh_009902 [Apium graveolens]
MQPYRGRKEKKPREKKITLGAPDKHEQLMKKDVGLSFRTTQEGLRNAFEKFGNLTEVNLVMDKIANRPRGFAFLCYTTKEESKKAIEGMHGKNQKQPIPGG